MAYAEALDIETRLKPKLARALTEDERGAAELLLEGASAAIDAALEKSEALESPPAVLRFVAVEVVCRAMANPQGLLSEQEGLGAYTHAERFVNAGGGLWLTDLETAMVRRAVHGSLSGSSEPESLASDTGTLRDLAPGSYGEVEGS